MPMGFSIEAGRGVRFTSEIYLDNFLLGNYNYSNEQAAKRRIEGLKVAEEIFGKGGEK